jgi:hypothetical protein
MSAIIDALRPKKAKKKATTGISSDAEDAKPVKESQGAPSSEAVFNGDETPKLGDEGVMGTDGVIRQRGPVEEVISKRARQLLKKIVSPAVLGFSAAALIVLRLYLAPKILGLASCFLLTLAATVQGLRLANARVTQR